MYILLALAFSFLAQAVLAQQPTPILPDPKLTPGDTFDVGAQDVYVPGYAKKVRAVGQLDLKTAPKRDSVKPLILAKNLPSTGLTGSRSIGSST
jgi:hypothetical protein